MDDVAIVDCKIGNLDSVARAVKECGGKPFFARRASELRGADRIILPGVGAFYDAMNNLKKAGLDLALREKALDNKTPLLGICLGMQALASRGFEGKETSGLGLIEGEVIQLKSDNASFKIPHIGWNEVRYAKESPLFDGIPSGKDFYFVHSYHFACKFPENVVGRTPYCCDFVSAVSNGNVFGVQFHPEKSQKLGLRVLKNFLEIGV